MILLLRCLGCGGGGGFGMTVWKRRGKAICQQGYNREAERQAIVVKTKRGKKISLPSLLLLTRLLGILHDMRNFSSNCNHSGILSLPKPWKIFSWKLVG